MVSAKGDQRGEGKCHCFSSFSGSLESSSAGIDEARRGKNLYLVKMRTDKDYILYDNEELAIFTVIAPPDSLTGKKNTFEHVLNQYWKQDKNHQGENSICQHISISTIIYFEAD